MNLRISENQLRFRLENRDLDQLLSNKTVSVDAGPLVANIKITNEKLVELIREDSRLCLFVSGDEIEALKTQKRSRESGLNWNLRSENGTSYKVILEVDLFKGKKPNE